MNSLKWKYSLLVPQMPGNRELGWPGAQPPLGKLTWTGRGQSVSGPVSLFGLKTLGAVFGDRGWHLDHLALSRTHSCRLQGDKVEGKVEECRLRLKDKNNRTHRSGVVLHVDFVKAVPGRKAKVGQVT